MAVLNAPSTQPQTNYLQTSQARANVGQLFFDLRNALRVTPEQIAAHLFAAPEAIVALETGQFEYLPPWPETARIVMGYTALAGIDGRPVLNTIADALTGVSVSPGVTVARSPAVPALIEQAALSPPKVSTDIAPKYRHRLPVAKWRQAGVALANGARQLPADALKQVRQRPERAFYALSLPIGILLILLNTSALEAAFSHVPRPVARLAQDMRHFFQEQFAPVHEGLRWIDVDDPRRRRGDKLR